MNGEKNHPQRLLRKLGRGARKRLGQHFLASGSTVDQIVDAAGLDGTSRVLEIGPGLGVMTEPLLERCGELVAVELDSELAGFLEGRFGDQSGFRLIRGDARTLPWAEVLEGSGWTVVANLPYNVGTPITTGLLAHPGVFERVVVMLQREVAERMVAEPGDRKRGSLSVFVEARSHRAVVARVPPEAFHPPPRVDSAVIRLDLYSEPRLDGVPAAAFDQVVRAVFRSPRKTLRRTLRNQMPDVDVDALLAQLQIDPRARAATLTLESLIALTRALGL